MHLYPAAFLALNLLFSTAPAEDAPLITEEQLAAPCDGRGCALVATEEKWPKGFDRERTQVINFDSFRFAIPADAELSIFSLGAGLIADYGDGERKIFINMEYSDHFQSDDTIELNRRATLSISDFPRIIFTETPSDPEPPLIYNRWIWRDAMSAKGLFFEETETAIVSRKGTLAAYYAETPSLSHKLMAYVTDNTKPDSYMLIHVDGFDFDTLENVIGSVH